MEDFKFIFFTERTFKNKPIFKLAHAYDYLCAIAYVTGNEDFINEWRPLSERLFKELAPYDGFLTDKQPNVEEYMTLMKNILSTVHTPLSLVKETRDFLDTVY